MSEIQLPSHWKTMKLGDVAKIERGKFMHRPRNDPAFYGGDIPFIQTGDVAASNGRIITYSQTLNEKGLSVSKIFSKGTVVITIAANIGYTGILEFDSAFPDSLIGITPNNGNINVDNEYLNYYLWTQQPEMDRQAPRGTQKNINIQFLAPWRVIIPPLSEQRAIAHTLRTIQKAKEARQRELELERERKATLMQHLLTYGTCNEATKQTEIGEIPKSWQVVQLRNVCLSEPQNGAFIKNPKRGTGTLFVNVVDTYKTTVVDLKTVERLECEESLLERYSLKEYDLLFVRSSLKREGVGQCCLVGKIEEFSIFDCHLIRVSPNQTLVNPFYLTYYFLSEAGKNDLIARSKTTTMTTINQNNLMESLVTLPSLAEQRVIAEVLSAFDTKITALEKEISTLDELFRAMLSELMTGRLSTQPLIEQEN